MRGRVLLVEDNPINQTLAKAMLQKLGLAWELANDGQEALDRVRASDYDLVLMDCQMPVMDGYAATAAIRQLPDAARAGVPIVALTANAMPGDEQKCLDSGMSGFLAKPYSLADLRATLLRWLPALPAPAAASSPRYAEPSKQGRADAADTPAIDRTVVDSLRELDESGGMGLALALFESFLATADQSLARLNAAIDALDVKGLAQVAHTLKSSTANVGATRLSALFRDIEKHARDGRFADASALIGDANAEFARAADGLQRLSREIA